MKISEQGNRAIRTVRAEEQNELGQKMLLAVGSRDQSEWKLNI